MGREGVFLGPSNEYDEVTGAYLTIDEQEGANILMQLQFETYEQSFHPRL